MNQWRSEVTELEVGQGKLLSVWTGSLGKDCYVIEGSFRIKLRNQLEKVIEGTWEISLSRKACSSRGPEELASVSDITFLGPNRRFIQHNSLSSCVRMEIEKRVIDLLDTSQLVVVSDRIKKVLLWRRSEG